MTVATIYVQVRCPECGLLLRNTEHNTTSCESRHCTQYGIVYELPKIDLKRVSEPLRAADVIPMT